MKVFGSVTPASFDSRRLWFSGSKRSFEDCDVVFSRSLFGVKNAWLVVALRVASCFVVHKEEVEVALVVGEVFVRFQSGGLCIVDFVEILFVILLGYYLVDFVLDAY